MTLGECQAENIKKEKRLGAAGKNGCDFTKDPLALVNYDIINQRIYKEKSKE